MAFSHERRFIKRVGLVKNIRLTLPIIKEHAGVPPEEIDEIYAKFKAMEVSDNMAIHMLCCVLNGGKKFVL
jgi:hypothetical protein